MLYICHYYSSPGLIIFKVSLYTGGWCIIPYCHLSRVSYNKGKREILKELGRERDGKRMTARYQHYDYLPNSYKSQIPNCLPGARPPTNTHSYTAHIYRYTIHMYVTIAMQTASGYPIPIAI